MENWSPSVVYTIAIERHRENVGRGEAAWRTMEQRGSRPTRAYLATVLVALAARLDPALGVARPVIGRGLA